MTDAQSRNSRCFQLVTRRKELVERHFATNFDPVLLEQFSIVPKHVPAMDAGEYGIDLSILGHQVHDQLFRKRLIPAVTLVEVGNRFAVTGIHVLTKQFPTGMGLPAVRWITAGQTSWQNGPSPDAPAARPRHVPTSHPPLLALHD